MKKILVDLSYINSDSKAHESVAMYAFKVLEGIEKKYYPDITLLVAEEYSSFFVSHFSNFRLLLYPHSKSFLYHMPYIKGICKMWKWKKFMNKQDFSVLYIPFAWSGNSLATKVKKVITIHDLRPMREANRAFTNTWWFNLLRLSSIYLYCCRFFYSKHVKNATKVIAISNYVKDDLVKEWKQYKHKVQTIYNGVVLSSNSIKPSSFNVSKPYILYVNSLNAYKNIETLVKAFENIKNRIPHILVIVGKDTNYWQKIQKYIRTKEFEGRIFRISYCTDEELKWLYEHASLFVTTSTREGFGYTPIEAAICQCPVISTRMESLPDVTDNKVNYYDPPLDWNKLAYLMYNLLTTPIEKKELEKLSVFFSVRYNNTSQAKKIYDLLDYVTRQTDMRR